MGVDEEPVTGTLRSPDDRDWFAVTLAPGRTYVFTLEGETPGGGTAPVIRNLRDANGDPVPGIVGGAEARYATDAGAAEAQYYIEVGGEDGSRQDTNVARGVDTRSAYTRSIIVRSVDTRSSDSGTEYQLWANDITETKDATEDHPSDTTTTGMVTVGGSVTGRIERAGDRDWFEVTLQADRLYRIDLEGTSTAAGSLPVPYLRGIYDAEGDRTAGTTDDNSGWGRNSRVFFMAPQDGTYYVSAGAHAHFVGTYRLSVADWTDVPDDFTAGPDTTGMVAVGGSVMARSSVLTTATGLW